MLKNGSRKLNITRDNSKTLNWLVEPSVRKTEHELEFRFDEDLDRQGLISIQVVGVGAGALVAALIRDS